MHVRDCMHVGNLQVLAERERDYTVPTSLRLLSVHRGQSLFEVAALCHQTFAAAAIIVNNFCTDGLCHPHSFPAAVSWSSDPLLLLAIVSFAAMPLFLFSTHFMLPQSSGWLPRQRLHVQAAYGHCLCLCSPPSFVPLSSALACASAYCSGDVKAFALRI